MKNYACLLLLAACAATPTQEATKPAASDNLQDDFQPDAPTSHHDWLQQLVGDWTVKMTASMGEGTEPMQMESTEKVRSLGGLWIVSEGAGDFGGQQAHTLMTLGYDEKKGAYVGTWVDSMHAYMWHYLGTLDASKKTLTLEADGPSFDDPSKTAKFRDAFTIVGKDEKKLTSSMLGPDGKWTQFMSATYTRKK